MPHRALLTLPLLCCVIACGQPLGCQRSATPNAPIQDPSPPSERPHLLPRQTRQLKLREHFLADNNALLERAPKLTQGKFLKMAQSPYNYFRGSANIALRDAIDPESAWRLDAAGAPSILLAGDPHPENFGTFRLPNGHMVVDLNDFDTAMTGPYLWDVHRLGVGFGMLWMMARAQGLMQDEDLVPLLNIVATSYLDELLAKKSDELTQSFASTKDARTYAGAIYADLIRRAVKDGDKKEAISDYTTTEQGQLVLHRGVIEASTHDLIARDVLTDASPQLIALVRATQSDYLASLLPAHQPERLGPPIDVARRLGAGVGSYPVQRLYVLHANDLLLEYKEILTPFVVNGFTLPSNTSQAQRAVAAQRALQVSPNADQWLGYVEGKGLSMKVRQRTKYQKGIKVDRMLEEARDGEWSMQDLHTFAQVSARVLARAHMRANSAALRPILPKLKVGRAAWLNRVTQYMQGYTQQTMRDYGMFVALLNPDGSFDMSTTDGP